MKPILKLKFNESVRALSKIRHLFLDSHKRSLGTAASKKNRKFTYIRTARISISNVLTMSQTLYFSGFSCNVKQNVGIDRPTSFHISNKV